MDSDNPFGADNQQGRLESYLSGFADGEGSFSVGATRRPDLTDRVIPFFIRNPLLSDKRHSFEIFASIVSAMNAGEHQTALGYERLVRLAFTMNGGGRYRKLALEELLGIQNPQRLHAGPGHEDR